MTGSRPAEGAAWGSGADPYAEPGALEDAVSALNDPLTDPLPPAGGDYQQPPPGPYGTYDAYGTYGPVHEPHQTPGTGGGDRPPGPYEGYPQPYQQPSAPAVPGLPAPAAPAGHGPAPRRIPVTRPAPAPAAAPDPAGPGRGGDRDVTGAEAAGRHRAATAGPEGGRAARRRAAKGGGRRRAGARPPAAPPPPARSGPATASPSASPSATTTAAGGRAARRQAAKAAAKAARHTGTAINNVIGELFITTGVVLLLFVAYEMWWTNVEAKAHANGQREELTEQWQQDDSGEDARDPGTFDAGEGWAILYLPTLDVAVPIAESTDKDSVLDQGMVGHYTEEDGLPTAYPWDEEGNVGLAGHRNTHGEPFRYINKLDPGDPIVIETEDTYYVYEMTSRLDSTSPSNTSVLDAVPTQGGFTGAGRYVTLTTCTPEFTSKYRLIVWGQLTEERPRSEGKPDALLDSGG